MNRSLQSASTLLTTAGAECDVQIVTAAEVAWFDQQLADQRYLGAGQPVGDYLRQVVCMRGRLAALLAWGRPAMR